MTMPPPKTLNDDATATTTNTSTSTSANANNETILPSMIAAAAVINSIQGVDEGLLSTKEREEMISTILAIVEETTTTTTTSSSQEEEEEKTDGGFFPPNLPPPPQPANLARRYEVVAMVARLQHDLKLLLLGESPS